MPLAQPLKISAEGTGSIITTSEAEFILKFFDLPRGKALECSRYDWHEANDRRNNGENGFLHGK